MMKMLKMMLVIVLTFGLVGSCAAVASAEMLFGVSASTGRTDFTGSYSGAYGAGGFNLKSVDDKADSLTANLELNLFLTRIYIDASKTSFSDSNFYKLGVSAGWELGPDLLRARLFAGGKGYIFEDRSNAVDVRNVFYALGGGAGVESKLGNLKVYGNVFIPVFAKYTNEVVYGNGDDSSPDMEYLEAGLSLSTVPFVEIFANYRKENCTADNIFEFDSTTYSAGVKVSF
jgi:hypothetical protein